MADALPNPPHMTPDEFRELGHRFVEWVASYHESLTSDAPPAVTPATKPGEVFAALPDAAPAHPGGAGEWDAIVRDLDALIVPNCQHWQHPAFFGYFSCNASFPAILGELVSAGLNVNGMLWATSPAATELEARVLDWCVDLFGLPAHFKSTSEAGGGVIQGTASEGTLVAMLAARERARRAHADEPFAVVCSDQAHSSVVKAAMIAGIALGPSDARHVRTVRTDDTGAMDAGALREALEAAKADGVRPIAVVATLGTTGTGAFDPLPDIVRTIDAFDPELWLHVDAAWAGSAFACPEFRGPMVGVERADSYCVNPHKWLLTNFDCDLFWTRDRAALVSALSITPEYLRNAATEAGGVIDYRDWQVPLGRRFRALKLWFVLRHYGVEGVRAHLRRGVGLAAAFAGWVEASERFELVTPVSLGLVVFRLRGAGGTASDEASVDRANRDLLARVNTRGRVFLSHTKVGSGEGGGRYAIRLAVGATHTGPEHVRLAWDELNAAAGG